MNLYLFTEWSASRQVLSEERDEDLNTGADCLGCNVASSDVGKTKKKEASRRQIAALKAKILGVCRSEIRLGSDSGLTTRTNFEISRRESYFAMLLSIQTLQRLVSRAFMDAFHSWIDTVQSLSSKWPIDMFAFRSKGESWLVVGETVACCALTSASLGARLSPVIVQNALLIPRDYSNRLSSVRQKIDLSESLYRVPRVSPQSCTRDVAAAHTHLAPAIFTPRAFFKMALFAAQLSSVAGSTLAD